MIAARMGGFYHPIGPSMALLSNAPAAGWPVGQVRFDTKSGTCAAMFPLQLLQAAPRIPFPHLPPIHREGRYGIEMAMLMRDPVYRGFGVPKGGGRPRETAHLDRAVPFEDLCTWTAPPPPAA